jgi:hypothetical protein
MRPIPFCALILLSACTYNSENIQSVTYQFDDASVAPEYQRNYTITVTANSIHATVDSYGRVLASSEDATTKEKFKEIRQLAADIFNRYSGKSESCDGGKAWVVSISDTLGNIRQLTWDCISPPQKVDDLRTKITEMVPELVKMLETPYPKEEEQRARE